MLVLTIGIFHLFPQHVLAQSSVKNGYIITIEGDSITGKLAMRPVRALMNGPFFKSKRGGNFKQYTPSQLSAFGIIGGKHYEAFDSLPGIFIYRERVFLETRYYQEYRLGIVDKYLFFLDPVHEDTIFTLIGKLRPISKKLSYAEKFHLNTMPGFQEVINTQFDSSSNVGIPLFDRNLSQRKIDQLLSPGSQNQGKHNKKNYSYLTLTPFMSASRGTVKTTLSRLGSQDESIPQISPSQGVPIFPAITVDLEGGLILSNLSRWDGIGIVSTVLYSQLEQVIFEDDNVSSNRLKARGFLDQEMLGFSVGLQYRPLLFPAFAPYFQGGFQLTKVLNRSSFLWKEYTPYNSTQRILEVLAFPETKSAFPGIWMRFGIGLFDSPIGQLGTDITFRRHWAYELVSEFDDGFIGEIRLGLSWKFSGH